MPSGVRSRFVSRPTASRWTARRGYAHALLALPAMQEWAADAVRETERIAGFDPPEMQAQQRERERRGRVTTSLERWSDRVKQAAAAKTALRLVGGRHQGLLRTGARRRALRHARVCGHRRLRFDRAGDHRALRYAARRHRTALLAEPDRCSPSSRRVRCRGDARRLHRSRPVRSAARLRRAVRDVVLGVRVLDGSGDGSRVRRPGDEERRRLRRVEARRRIAWNAGRDPRSLAQLRCRCRRAKPRAIFELDPDEAMQRVNEWGGQPLPLSAPAAITRDGCTCACRVRKRSGGGDRALAGLCSPMAKRSGRRFGNSARILRPARVAAPLWRTLGPSTAQYADLGGAAAARMGRRTALAQVADPGKTHRARRPRQRAWANGRKATAVTRRCFAAPTSRRRVPAARRADDRAASPDQGGVRPRGHLQSAATLSDLRTDGNASRRFHQRQRRRGAKPKRSCALRALRLLHRDLSRPISSSATSWTDRADASISSRAYSRAAQSRRERNCISIAA